MLIQRAQIAVEEEASEGTAETLVAADAFLVFNPRFEPSIEAHERDPARSALSPHASLFGKRSGRIMFDVELRGGAGGAGAAVDFSDAFKACGVSETLVAGTSATYTPASGSIPSVTVGLFMDGKRYRIWGARGTFKITAEAGRPAIISFEFTGADFDEADVSLLSGVSYNTVKAPTFQSASLTIDSYAAVVSKIELDKANALALRQDANASSGHKSVVITNQRPTLSFDPENVLVATEDFFGNWRSGAEMAFTTTLGSDAGNTIAITAPKVQYQRGAMADREGVSILEMQGLCCINSGDDEWQIAIT